ncbi:MULTISPECIES: TetR/AcrR family transcriptional regulator [Streptomyces]|uniref:TetR/AcrR family transcriptional regulator n=1 Tax=Streptomyces TaxID=1883 RepID=UPI000CD59A05|nr:MULTISPECIES: TetR/AcrR family transcriptional regulator [Streptomyces]
MSPSPTPSGATGTTARTRRAILDAAATCYAADLAAPLSDIARAADVGRSTLHRYFPDRAALIRALVADTVEATKACFAEAELDRGTAAEALARLVPAVFELSPRLAFLFSDTSGDVLWDDSEWEAAHAPVGALHHRGLAEGYFAPEITVDWFVRTLWYLVDAGWEAVREGALPKYEAIALVTRTMHSGLTADPPATGATTS